MVSPENRFCDSKRIDRGSGPLRIGQHSLSQDTVRPRLIAFAAPFQPCDHIGVKPHRDGLLQRTIKPASDCILPRSGRKFRDIGGIDLLVGQRSLGR